MSDGAAGFRGSGMEIEVCVFAGIPSLGSDGAGGEGGGGSDGGGGVRGPFGDKGR